MSTPQVTSASAWSSTRREGMVIELPTGNFARVRRTMDLVLLLKTGQIPNPLATIVNEMIRKQQSDFPTEKMDETAIKQMLDLVDQTCEKCFIEPRVEIPGEGVDRETFEPSEGAISIDDLEMRDRFYVFGFVQGSPADLARFREATGPTLPTAQDGEGVLDEAEQSAGTD